MSDIIGISLEEATFVKNMIEQQSTIAKSAIQKVIQSPSQLINFKGNRRRQFDETISNEIKRLQNALSSIDEVAIQLKNAIEKFQIADN